MAAQLVAGFYQPSGVNLAGGVVVLARLSDALADEELGQGSVEDAPRVERWVGGPLLTPLFAQALPALQLAQKQPVVGRMIGEHYAGGGVPVVVDCGVHGYDGDPYREYARSTRAHNTVSIDGREQSEPWATFRMGGRGRVTSVDTATPPGGYRFSGAYTPHFDRRTKHHRTIERRAAEWKVTDRVTGRPGARLSSYLHLHPTWSVRRVADRIRIESEGREVDLTWFGIDEVAVRRGEEKPQQGWFFPEFGRAEPIYTIEMIVEENDASSFGFTLRPMGWS